MYLNFEADKPKLNEWNVLIFLLFYNDLYLNNQKILWLPSIYQFERTGTNVDHPSLHTLQLQCIVNEKIKIIFEGDNLKLQICQNFLMIEIGTNFLLIFNSQTSYDQT